MNPNDFTIDSISKVYVPSDNMIKFSEIQDVNLDNISDDVNDTTYQFIKIRKDIKKDDDITL